MQPSVQIGCVTATVTGYRAETDFGRSIRADRQTFVEATIPEYIGHLPEPEPVPGKTTDVVPKEPAEGE